MIPKNVISCWFGRGEKSELFKRCRESKERVLAGWNFIDITEDNCGVMDTPHMRALAERKQYASMPELARLWALFKFGGVYLDEDVEVLKDFTPLLDQEFFIGFEDGVTLCGAVMGSEPQGATISHMSRVFPIDGDASEKPTFYTPGRMLAGVRHTAYPPEYFFPYRYDQRREDAVITPNTYAMHHWAGSWQDYNWKGKVS